jgi:hypothetical protein
VFSQNLIWYRNPDILISNLNTGIFCHVTDLGTEFFKPEYSVSITAVFFFLDAFIICVDHDTRKLCFIG